MSDEAATLRQRIDKLNDDLTGARAESARRKEQLRAVHKAMGTTNATELSGALDALGKAGGYRKLSADLDAARARADADPAQVQKDLDAARGELRTLRHRGGFAEIAGDKALGLAPGVSPERLMTLAGWKADADQFDPKAARSAVEALKATDPYLFAAGQTAGGSAPQPGQTPPAPPEWAARGATGQTVAGAPPTDAQLRDPVYMLTQFQFGK